MLFVIYAKVTEEMESEVINNCYRFFTPAMMRQYAMIIADLKDIKKHHAVYVSFFGEDHDKIVLPRKIGQNINEAIFSNDDTDSIRKMRSSTREAVRILSHTCKGIFNFVDGLSDIEESYR